MKFKLNKKSRVLSLLIIVGLATLFFQNCSPLKFSTQVQQPDSSSESSSVTSDITLNEINSETAVETLQYKASIRNMSSGGAEAIAFSNKSLNRNIFRSNWSSGDSTRWMISIENQGSESFIVKTNRQYGDDWKGFAFRFNSEIYPLDNLPVFTVAPGSKADFEIEINHNLIGQNALCGVQGGACGLVFLIGEDSAKYANNSSGFRENQNDIANYFGVFFATSAVTVSPAPIVDSTEPVSYQAFIKNKTLDDQTGGNAVPIEITDSAGGSNGRFWSTVWNNESTTTWMISIHNQGSQSLVVRASEGYYFDDWKGFVFQVNGADYSRALLPAITVAAQSKIDILIKIDRDLVLKNSNCGATGGACGINFNLGDGTANRFSVSFLSPQNSP